MREREERRRRRQARALQLFLVASVVPATYTPPLPINTTLEHIGTTNMVWHKTTHFIFHYFSNFYQSSGSTALNLCHGLKQFSCGSKRYGGKKCTVWGVTAKEWEWCGSSCTRKFRGNETQPPQKHQRRQLPPLKPGGGVGGRRKKIMQKNPTDFRTSSRRIKLV